MKEMISIGIATKNRPTELIRCIRSISLLDGFEQEVIVVDDGSDKPVETVVRAAVSAQSLANVTFVRWTPSRNLMAARNEIVRRANGRIVLLLDDDAYLLDGQQVAVAMRAMLADQTIGSMGFPESDAQGRVKPKQPGKGKSPTLTTHFYGYMHALRRDSFLSLGGYREFFGFYHEESDLCKRLLNIGYICVYWPSVRVAHVPSAVHREGRNLVRFQYGLRNRCLDAMCNEPSGLCALTLLTHCVKYAFGERRWRRIYGRERTGGTWWLPQELKRMWPTLRHERAPLKLRVFVRWRLTRIFAWPYLR